MIDNLSFNQISPETVLLVLVGLVLLSIFITFILPAILKQEKLRFSIIYSFSIVRKNFALSASLIIIVILIGAVGYYYYTITRPIVISAADFKIEEQSSLDELKHSSMKSRYEAQIFLIDIRTQKDFFDSHLFGSFNVPIEYSESQNIEPFRDRIVAVYSWKDKYDEGYSVAKFIKDKNVTKKVYLISDGFEGLMEVGIDTETGIPD